MERETASILAVAARVPPFALAAEVVDRAYGRPPGSGGRRLAAYDEDALTLAYEAADRCLRGFDRSLLRALYVASTSWPRAAAAQAERIAAWLDLPESVEVSTFAGSLRCGASALRLALSSPSRPALVVAADRLTSPPGSEQEASLGDAAAAVLVGDGEGIARVGNWTSRADVTEWASADVRFVTTQAARLAGSVPREGCVRAGVSAPGIRAARAAAGALRIPSTIGAMDKVGFCGAAHPLLALVELIEGASAGERLLWAAVGDGVEGATLEVVRPPSDPTLAHGLARVRPLTAYGTWLASRTFFDDPAQQRVFASPAMEKRDEEHLLRLHGTRCAACRATHTLPSPVCADCGAVEGLSRMSLSREGKVFTFTHEHYVPTPTPPVTMAVVDLEGGGRILVQVADALPDEVRTGARVRLVPRRLHMGGGVPNYYWKAVLA
ncbi:MAG: OB-fold domain-containing protein [Planctomycetota bacterium]